MIVWRLPNINSFDAHLIHLLNLYAQRSWTFDTFVEILSENLLFSGGLVTAVLWWAWFRDSDTQERSREIILSGFVMWFLVLFTSRTLALMLPFRERPLRVPMLHFNIPHGMSPAELIDWSSFPSDHAAVYFSLATTIFFISRRLGVLAYCHALFIVCLPRIYLGLHFPTDILAGAVLGIGITSLSLIKNLRTGIAAPALALLHRSPAYFYSAFYCLTALVATNFEPARRLAMFAWHVIRATGHAPG